MEQCHSPFGSCPYHPDSPAVPTGPTTRTLGPGETLDILWSWWRQSGRKVVSCRWTAKFMPAVKREILKPQQSFCKPIDARRHEKKICIGRFCYFLTRPWQYLLGYLCFLPKKCQMREEVCTPGEFNITMPFGGRKEREKGNCRKEQSQEIETGEEEEEQWNKQFGGILVWHFLRSYYTTGTGIIKYYGSLGVWEYTTPCLNFCTWNSKGNSAPATVSVWGFDALFGPAATLRSFQLHVIKH